jgi:hypothetical protein
MENVPEVFFWRTLQEPNEIYAGELTFGNDALTRDNTIAWEKIIENAELKRAPPGDEKIVGWPNRGT